MMASSPPVYGQQPGKSLAERIDIRKCTRWTHLLEALLALSGTFGGGIPGALPRLIPHGRRIPLVRQQLQVHYCLYEVRQLMLVQPYASVRYSRHCKHVCGHLSKLAGQSINTIESSLS